MKKSKKTTNKNNKNGDSSCWNRIHLLHRFVRRNFENFLQNLENFLDNLRFDGYTMLNSPSDQLGLIFLLTLFLLCFDFSSIFYLILPASQQGLGQIESQKINLLDYNVLNVENITSKLNATNYLSRLLIEKQGLEKIKGSLENLDSEENARLRHETGIEDQVSDFIQIYEKYTSNRIFIRHAHSKNLELNQTSNLAILLHDTQEFHAKANQENQQICCSALFYWIGTLEKLAKFGIYSLSLDLPGYGFSQFTTSLSLGGRGSSNNNRNNQMDTIFEKFENFMTNEIHTLSNLQTVTILAPVNSFDLIVKYLDKFFNSQSRMRTTGAANFKLHLVLVNPPLLPTFIKNKSVNEMSASQISDLSEQHLKNSPKFDRKIYFSSNLVKVTAIKNFCRECFVLFEG